MTDYRVRLATAADANAIGRIYNQGIEDRVATLETELRTPDERRQWLANRSPRHLVIVAEVTEPGRASVGPPTAQVGLRVPSREGGGETERGRASGTPPTECSASRLHRVKAEGRRSRAVPKARHPRRVPASRPPLQ